MHDQYLGCAFVLPKFLNRCSVTGFTSGNGAPTQDTCTLRLLTYKLLLVHFSQSSPDASWASLPPSSAHLTQDQGRMSLILSSMSLQEMGSTDPFPQGAPSRDFNERGSVL